MFDSDGMWRFQIELSAGQRLIVQEIEMRCEIDPGTKDYDPDTIEVRDLNTDDGFVSLKSVIGKCHTRCGWMNIAARYQLQNEYDDIREELAKQACGDYAEREAV